MVLNRSGFLSYTNPNYKLISNSDENCNIEHDDGLDDLLKSLDISCRTNRKADKDGQQNYDLLGSSSMGVDTETEITPMLSPENINESEAINFPIRSKSFQFTDNGNSIFDSNDNKEMGKRSNLLDYYISLEAATQKQEKSQQFPVFCNNGLGVESSSSNSPKGLNYTVTESRNSESCLDGPSSPEKLSSSESIDRESLPSGWEKHEDESGPYYWHISSGTIQREPPLSQMCSSKTPTRLSKDLDLLSSRLELCLKTCKTSGEAYHHSILNKATSASDNKTKRRSCPDGSCSLSSDKRPIRFAVRSLGWVEIAEADLTPERSSKAVNKCIVDLSIGRNDILDVVGRWGDGKDLFMDLDDYSLRLLNTQDLTVLNTQPIHTIRVWGVGRENGRDFAYVARDRVTKKFMCHVFRCDIPARIIANTLRDICKKIMIERSLQRNLEKQVETSSSQNDEDSTPCTPARPTDLPMNQGLFPHPESESSYSGQFFPTPMEEPKKVLKVYYLGSTDVEKATGVETLNNAIEKLYSSVPKSEYKLVNVAVAPSTITISEPGDEGQQLAECRVRFLSFLGIGKNVKHCGFIVHTAQDDFVTHVFHCEPSAGALCKTIEAACKLRYQKCLDSHKQDSERKVSEAQKKGLGSALKNVFGTLLKTRMSKSTET